MWFSSLCQFNMITAEGLFDPNLELALWEVRIFSSQRCRGIYLRKGLQISVIRHGHDSVAPQSFSSQRGPSHRFVPGGWILSRRDFEPEAKRPCLGPRDAAKPVSELRGRSPPKEMGEKINKSCGRRDARHGFVPSASGRRGNV